MLSRYSDSLLAERQESCEIVKQFFAHLRSQKRSLDEPEITIASQYHLVDQLLDLALTSSAVVARVSHSTGCYMCRLGKKPLALLVTYTRV
jgi:hypothetical protein